MDLLFWGDARLVPGNTEEHHGLPCCGCGDMGSSAEAIVPRKGLSRTLGFRRYVMSDEALFQNNENSLLP